MDIIFKLDEICKKYEKYDVEKQRDQNTHGDDTFARLYAFVESEIESSLHGTGDLTTTLLLRWSDKFPDNLDKAAELVVSSLQALLQRTVNDYKAAGYDPKASSLEIRLIQSQDDIRKPQIRFKAQIYT